MNAPIKEDILQEQLAFLVKHYDGCVERECGECARLCGVVEALLAPFKVEEPAWIKKKAA
jgi:hypothetical protein